MSLADGVLARHQPDETYDFQCRACDQEPPCDAYRLAVMVRDVIAECQEVQQSEGMSMFSGKGGSALAARILAITREAADV